MGGRSSKDNSSSPIKHDDSIVFDELLMKWKITPLDLLRPLTDESISNLQIETHISGAIDPHLSSEERRKDLIDATPIHLAAELDNVKILEEMVKAILSYSRKIRSEKLSVDGNGDSENMEPGVDWNIRDAKGLSPLSRAVRNETIHAVQLLIDVGADPFAPYCTIGLQASERWAWSYLRYAAWHGKNKSLKALLTVKDIEDDWGPDGKRPIHLAVENGQLETVKALLHQDLRRYYSNEKRLIPEYASQARKLSVARFIVRAPGLREHSPGISSRIQNGVSNETNTVQESRSRQTHPNPIAHDLLEILRGVLRNDEPSSEGSAQRGADDSDSIVEAAQSSVSRQMIVSRDRGSSLLHLATTYGQNEILAYLLKHPAFSNSLDTLNEFGKSPIFMAVRHGHLHCLKTLQAHGVKLESTDIENWSTVHEAVKYRNMEILNYLLENGCNANSADDDGWTPLHVAARFGAFPAVLSLVSAGADIDAITDENETVLKLAVMQVNNEKMLEKILEHGPDMRKSFNQHASQSPIRVLIERRDFSMLNVLLCHMKMISSRDKHYNQEVKSVLNDNSTILHRCVASSAITTVKLLLEMGADPSIKNASGETPTYLAARKDMHRVVSALLSCNANPDEAHRDGSRPIHIACDIGHHRVVEVLLSSGSNGEITVPDSAANGGFTPLMLASRRGHAKCVLILIQFGVNLNTQKGDGYTALHLAALNGHIEVLKILLRAGALTAISENHGFLPLHVAVRNQQFDATATLLAYGSDPGALGPAGLTALHFAAHVCDARAVWLLLQCGVPVLSVDSHGASALHYCARQPRGQSCLQLLLTCGADVNSEDEEKETALHCAAQAGISQNARVLLKRGADPHKRNNMGYTPLHNAVIQGSELVVNVLLNFGANGHDKDNDGNTPYQLATKTRNQQARLLIWRALGCSVDDVAPVKKYDVSLSSQLLLGTLRESMKSSSGIIEEEMGELCVVCQNVLQLGEDVRALPCSHTYHADCIIGWFGGKACEDHDYCPLCHLSVLPVDIFLDLKEFEET